MADSPERETFRIPEANLELLQTKIDRLNKKAQKLSCPEITITVVREEMVIVDNDPLGPNLNTREWMKYLHIIINGEAPVIAGWQFAATLQHEKAGNVIRAMKGNNFSIPERYRTVQPNCEHCNANRRRKRTLIVHNPETGEFKQVGDGCLKDFLGHPNPEYYARWMEMIFSLEDEAEELASWSGGRGPTYIDLKQYLAWVSACIRLNGWVSRKAEEEYNKYATSSRALEYMNPNPHLLWKDPKYREEIELHTPTEEDRQLVETVISWVRNDVTPRPEKSDYIHNLTIVIGQDHIKHKSAGIAASVIAAYRRETEVREEKAQKKHKPPSIWVGTVDQKITVEVTVTKKILMDSEWGVKYLYKMETTNGDILVWFTKGELEEGQTYKLAGKVKEHKEYKGKKETVLTRCKVL